jgi:two-component system NtrC family sensor kinase
MKKLFIFLLLLPLFTRSQTADTTKILTASNANTNKENKGWLYPSRNWRWKAGDNPKWADPSFVDTGWNRNDLSEIPYSSPQVPEGSIVWMRVRVKNDSSFAQPLVMRLSQSGASEIYLDGKLIHRLGVIDQNPGFAKYYDPGRSISLSFPLINDSTQLLAVRFLNMPEKFPIYGNPSRKGYFNPSLAKLVDSDHDYYKEQDESDVKNSKIVFGAAIILGVLFLSLYLFFKVQRVNLLFSLCCFSLAAGVALAPAFAYGHGPTFFLGFCNTLLTNNLYTLLFLLCIYRVHHQKIGWQFRTILALSVLSIPAIFIIDAGYYSLPILLLLVCDAFRVTTRNRDKTQSAGTRILQVCLIMNLVYWLCLLLGMIAVLKTSFFYEYQIFAMLLNPLGLAIFLGYSFGTTSLSLRQKLVEVEELSKEKQNILASQNELLEKQVMERTAALHQSITELKAAQAQLIQSEKMASLGELTAGIAHEIQNPLNFVNNFSEVSRELLDEMTEAIAARNYTEVEALASDINSNLEKIHHHGKRADGIVKGMLQHSRSSSGQKELVDINALADEYLRLAYHGLRAKDKSFNATLKTDFDEAIGKINIVPQDIGRVILNLITNAFYVVAEKKALRLSDSSELSKGYEPTVSVKTKKISDRVEITITDNGNGIPQPTLEKIFQPFFTTKPTGQGTGLGLSLSYDIVKAHGGELSVKTKEGEGTEFIIQLPGNI